MATPIMPQQNPAPPGGKPAASSVHAVSLATRLNPLWIARRLWRYRELIVQVLFFMSPLFYPVSAVPERFRLILYLNPLTPILDGFRRILLWQQPLSWPLWVCGAPLASPLRCWDSCGSSKPKMALRM